MRSTPKHQAGKTAEHSHGKKSLLSGLRTKLSDGFRRNPTAMIIILAAIVIAAILIVKLVGYVTAHTDIRVSDDGYTHAEQFEDCLVIHGIDVSEHQGEDINWKKVKSSGVDFVFIRAGYRGAETGKLNTDACFRENVKRAKKAGLMVGAYYYSQATTSDEAIEEARAMLEIVKGFSYELPLVIDYEIYPGGRLDQLIDTGSMNAAYMYHDIVLAFCSEIEAAGYISGIYANTDMYTHYMDASYIDTDTNLWVAQFDDSCSLESSYRFWQCSDSETVGGIEGAVDKDFLYLKLDGATPVYDTGVSENTADAESIEGAAVMFKKDAYSRKLKGTSASFTMADASGRKMREGRDYLVSFVKNTEKGTGYALIRGIGKYTGIILAPFDIK